MKKIVLVSLLAMFVFSGCFLIDQFAESTVRVVNDSDYDITGLALNTGVAGRSYDPTEQYNVLEENEVIEPGEDIILGLAPVLHENSYAGVVLKAPDNDTDTSDHYEIDFTYEEGAEVILVFNGVGKEPFSIENGEQFEMFR